MKLRIGIVGLGSVWDTRHRPALRSLADRFEVRAVCEPVAHRACGTAKDFGAVALDSFRLLAHREDVDAIVYLSSHWYGALPIIAACEAGKAIYCATAVDLDQHWLETIRTRVQASGIAFISELPYRLSPATLRLKELIVTQLGKPRLLFCHRRHSQPNYVAGEDPQRATMRELRQLVDWCRYVVGDEPTSVVGLSHQIEPNSPDNGDDYQMMSLDFSNCGALGTGAVAQISCSRYMPPAWHEAVTFRPPAAMQVACERGIAFIDLPSTLIWFDEAGRHMESLDSERPVGEQLLLHFYRSVTSLIRSTSSIDDAYHAHRIVTLAGKSFSSGQRQHIGM
jgi:predicted dehydrogenase